MEMKGGIVFAVLLSIALLCPIVFGQVTSNEASDARRPVDSGMPKKDSLEETVFAEMLRIVDQKFDSLSARISVLERSVSSLNFYSVRQFREITESIEHSTEMTEGLRDQMTRMDADDRALKAAVSQVSRDINSINRDINGISLDVDVVKRDVDAMQTTVTDFRSNSEKVLDDLASSVVYLSSDSKERAEEVKVYVRDTLVELSDKTNSQLKEDTAILVRYLDDLDFTQPRNCSVNFSPLEKRMDLRFAEMKRMTQLQFLDLLASNEEEEETKEQDKEEDDDEEETTPPGTKAEQDTSQHSGHIEGDRDRAGMRRGAERSGDERDRREGEKVMRLLANMTSNVMDAVAYFRHNGDMMERLLASTDKMTQEQTRLRYDVLEASGLLTAGDDPGVPSHDTLSSQQQASNTNTTQPPTHQSQASFFKHTARANTNTNSLADRTRSSAAREFGNPNATERGGAEGVHVPGAGARGDESLRVLAELAKNGTQLLDVMTDLAQLTSTSLTKAVGTLHEEVVRLEDVRARLNEGLLLPAAANTASGQVSAGQLPSLIGGGGDISSLQNTTKTIFTIVEAIASNTGWIPYIFHNMQQVERLTNRTLELAKRSLLNMHWNQGAGIPDPETVQETPQQGGGWGGGGRLGGAGTLTQAEAMDVIYDTSVQLNRIMPALTRLLAEPEPLMALAEGKSSQEGRVDVYYQGRWGSVCRMAMGHPEASAVCRHLGHSGGIWAGDVAAERSSSGRYWELNMTCLHNPQLCPFVVNSNYSTVDCPEGDFTVICDHMLRITPQPDTTDTEEQEEEGTGLLSLHHQGRWLPVCSDGWTSYEARVACKQMGFRDGRALEDDNDDNEKDEVVKEKKKKGKKEKKEGVEKEEEGVVGGDLDHSNATVWVAGVSCTGEEVRLDACKVDTYVASHCQGQGQGQTGRPAAVRCQ